MEVILLKDFELLGDEGTKVNVKDGYARNYLIPNGIACPSTLSNLKHLEEIKKQKSRKVQKELQEAQKLSAELENLKLEISVRTGEEDKIYGSVTSQMILDTLKAKGYDLEKRKINLNVPIKTLGEYVVDVKLFPNVISKVKISVISENKPESKAEDVLDETTDETTDEA